MLNERWMPIPSYEELYEISTLGRVRSTKRQPRSRWPVGHIRKPAPNTRGYMHLPLHKGGISKTYYVHRLVAAAFLGPCPEGYEVNHKDGDRTNNCLANLEYVTSAENKHHANKHFQSYLGVNNGNAKLTPRQVRQIRKQYEEGASIAELARQYPVTYGAIKKIVLHITWRHVS